MMHRLRGESVSRTVWLDEVELSPIKSQKVKNHSPDGFAWGYGGSGPSQLALAVMLELYPQRIALAKYQQFKFNTIAILPVREDFDIEFEA
jgi:hypothetical protein